MQQNTVKRTFNSVSLPAANALISEKNNNPEVQSVSVEHAVEQQ